MNETSLDKLACGQKALVVNIEGHEAFAARLKQMGITKQVQIVKHRQAPLGDPSLYLVRGTLLAIRKDDAKHILVRPLHMHP